MVHRQNPGNPKLMSNIARFRTGQVAKIGFAGLLISVLIIFATLQIGCASAATVSNGHASKSRWQPETEFTFSGGLRRDDLDWNIAGNRSGNNPNVLSELTWDDIKSYQVKVQGRLEWPNIVSLRGSADYGWVFDGDNRDSDYLGDNRTQEFSRSNNSADNGHLWDASMAVGYPFRFGRQVVATTTPLVGWSHHEQHLTISDGNQTIPDTGSFSGLHSSYDTRWKGPWVGLDLRFRAGKIRNFIQRLEPYFTYEYHWADYHAKANWNLRNDLDHPKSFEHNADATGYVIATGFNIALHENAALNINFDYQDWSTDHGTHKVFFSNGKTAKTRLNEVNWSTYALSLGFTLRF